jgi:hypothetical protein
MLKQLFYLLLTFLLVSGYAIAGDFIDDFEDAEMDGWITLDEPAKLLNDKGPSNWAVLPSPAGKNNLALNQSSNIWGDQPDVIPLGTFAIYDLSEWINFDLTVDVYAQDDDCLGLIWGWKDRTHHYRFITMIDPANPSGAGADRAPWSKIEKRIGDDEPYYNTISRVGQASYQNGANTKFRLTVDNNKFSVYSNDKLVIEASDLNYSGGKIGFTMIAEQGCFFDNVKVVNLAEMVNSKERLASTWGYIKK